MAKAYDRVSWSSTCLMLRRMGFGERIIDMIRRTMSNNWYSVIVNGSKWGFFHSTRGLKQGDPLAPALFIIGAELLSRMLNIINHDQLFNGFYMERRGPQLNHLSFADNIIIFTYGKRSSLQKIMWILNNYESTSGQQINRHKSHFMTSPCAFSSAVRRIQSVTGFTKKSSPLTYLGCPLYIPVSPPMTVMKQVEKLAANFFWGMENNKRKYHWASWHKLCFPVNEGGLGFRKIEDICKSMEYKQWWYFRTTQSLCSSFLKAKYCQRSNPISKKWDTGQWNIQKLNASAPANMIHLIMQNPIFFNSNIQDTAIWTPFTDGRFTCATSWELIRIKKQPNFSNKMTWHKKIPFKRSFCLWRALRNKLPTDDRVLSFSSPTVTRCRIGAGVIIRDHNSGFIHAMAAPLGEGTNNFAETEAAFLGIQWCLNNGFTKIHLESDSALLIQWLTKGRNFPWSIKMKLQQLLDLYNLCESFICSHTYREANCPIDSLSKLSHDLTTMTEYNNVSALTTHIKGQIQQDFLVTPTFRHKRTRKIMVPSHHASSFTSSHGYG
ncbi:PREDICTED: uncharacterized protein LOC109241591 [Nicotiana attenuata]|uniref:uncharacterized protein LOC109241591 n=1 Tax=Nicotiana attenuata TaxID=49451 RepID=UPI000905616E|nr:PREDICTED: uncharacterized protein LOC109241591 [Nicotiana attenuata]